MGRQDGCGRRRRGAVRMRDGTLGLACGSWGSGWGRVSVDGGEGCLG